MAPVGDDDVARIHVRGVHAEVAEGQRDDVAGEPLAVAGDGVDRARRQFAEHGQAFDQFGQLLEMLVEGAVELGALGERHHQARLARVEIAQVVELPDVLVALALDGGLRRWRAACWWSCPWRRPPPRAGGLARACTMPATRSMAAADSTEVPPNFMTIIQSEHPFRMHQLGIQHAAPAAPRMVLWLSTTNL